MVIPIKVLSPYRQRWAIKGRVTSKGPVREWNNARGSGKLFKVDIADANGGEISVNCFKDAVDRFKDVFEEGKIYYIARGQVKGANKKFATGNTPYEITLDTSSIVQPAPEQSDIPRLNWSPCRIADLQTQDMDGVATVMGVVLQPGSPADISPKLRPGETLRKRTLLIGDRSRASIEVTLWGEKVDQLEPLEEGMIIGLKNINLKKYGGLSLSASPQTRAELNPDCKEAHELAAWFQREGHSITFTPLTQHEGRQGFEGGASRSAGGARQPAPHLTCAEVRAMQLGNHDKTDFFHLKATITMFAKKDNAGASSGAYYRACTKCNKKVEPVDTGYLCEHCRETYPACAYRYLLSFHVSDHTGQLFMNSFNDVAAKVLGCEAEHLAAAREQGDDASYAAAFDNACFTSYKMKCRAFTETYQEKKRIKYSVSTLDPVNFVEDAKELIKQISAYAR